MQTVYVFLLGVQIQMNYMKVEELFGKKAGSERRWDKKIIKEKISQ